MKHLRLFETETDYDSEVSEFEYPTVSLVQDVDDVRYMTLRDKYTREYLTFEALESGTFTLNIPANVNSTYMTSVSYSTDDGENWTTTNVDSTAQTITTPAVNAGDKVLWKGIGKQMSKSASSNNYSYFSSTGNFNARGNIMSLLYGDNFQNNTSFNSGSNYNFSYIFRNVTKLTDAVNLILPATTMDNCYNYMFYGCTALTTAPVLPATTLASHCYEGMFYGCTALTTTPVLPATTMGSFCYQYMFKNCTALTTAPVLSSTTLASGCYRGMFSGCTTLTTAPELPATTLPDNQCYADMFSGCTSLTTAPELPATTLGTYCYNYMFSGCTALTAPPVLPATTLASYCYTGMFNNCTALTAPPVLPATTLADNCYKEMFYRCTRLATAPTLSATTLASSCYQNMFYGCTSLTTAPELPATTLVYACYNYMFNGCSRLNYIKAMFTTTPSTSYTNNWVSGVAASGTFVKNSAAQWDVTGTSGVPSGWTVETASS